MSRPAPGGFWTRRRVLVTGHTGFKGSWLTAWLQELGAEVMGISLEGSPASPRLWETLGLQLPREVSHDLAQPGWEQEVTDFGPQVVLHLAAQSLVPAGYRDPLTTWTSNVQGTARVLALLPALTSLEATLVVTTDKVYDPRQPPPHAESDYLGGHDPYSASKAATELLVASWPFTDSPVATARAGNVIGGGDTSPDRLLPDVVQSWTAGRAVELRAPASVRPWQHVLEPLRGYLAFAEALAAGRTSARSLNFGPVPGQLVSVESVVQHAAQVWYDAGQVVPDGGWRPANGPQIPENPLLEIDSSKAAHELAWHGVIGWQESVAWTMEWYARAARGERPLDLVVEQIHRHDERLGDPAS